MNNHTQDSQSELTYGYDPASPEGDYSALTIKHKDNFYNFVGDEADVIEAYVTTRVKEAERLARLDEQKRTDGAYKRFHVKESAEGDYIGAETDWISGEKRIEQLEALTTTTNGKGE